MKLAKTLLVAAMLSNVLAAAPAFALDAVKVINGTASPVPISGSVTVSGTPSVNVTNTVPVTGTVNVGSMPPVNVTTSSAPTRFVVPFAMNVAGIDHIGVTLTRPAILDSVAVTCNGSLVGTHFQITTDLMTTSATAFDPPPAGVQLVARSSSTGNYAPVTPALNYPPYEYQALLDYPNLATSNFSVSGLGLVVLSDVNVLGPAFNPGATYCWGSFLFQRL
jgi:hypothetical protein